MFRKTITIGNALGIPIAIDYTWFLIFILVTWTLASGYFPSEYPQWSQALYWSVAAVTSVLFFASVLLHELGHSVVAQHYKIQVRKIVLFIFGGVAQIQSEPPSAKAEFWIAIAGPLVSFALGGFFYVLEFVFKGFSPLLALAEYLAYINGTLGLFNLIPGFPLDGGRVFRAIWWGVSKNYRKATSAATIVGEMIAFLFILAGVWLFLGGNLLGGIWIVFIGWFLESASSSQKQQLDLQDLLSEHQVVEAMNRSYVIIPADTTLEQIATDPFYGVGRRFYIVEDSQGGVAGIVTPHNIQEVQKEWWPSTLVSKIMVPADKMHKVEQNENLWAALETMDEDGVNQQPVMQDGQILGVLSRDGIIRFLRSMKSPKRAHEGGF